jgi:D-3-phosphoglycerate dehydrogenase
MRNRSPGGPFLLFDFDSTLVGVEALDELFEEALREGGGEAGGRAHGEAGGEAATSAEAAARDEPRPAGGVAGDPAPVERFRAITDAGMEGSLSHEASLAARLALFPGGGPTPEQVARTAERVARAISASVLRNREFFARNRGRIRIVSGGFSELIAPAARLLGIPPDQVTAHAFRPGGHGTPGSLLVLDPSTPMARGGKVGAVRELLASGAIPPGDPLWIVGDGATDLELRTAGVAGCFVAFTEHQHRASVVAAADHVAGSVEALLELLARHAPDPSPPTPRGSRHDGPRHQESRHD